MKFAVISVAVLLLIITVFVFSRLGGEFIPTLEEGDYAIEFVLPQGSSITQTIETVMMAQRMLLRFPEVKMIVGKTGAADIATDPMPPEASDLLVIMKDKKEWTTTKNFYQMADMMRDTLSNIPGVIAEPSQPIQMRFNELMTGIRQDVAIKIFGENLDTLSWYAKKVANAVNTIEGITQPQIERIAGLPQITVLYDRSRLAGYGLNIEDVNHVISTAFAGEIAGVVYENERRFNLVLRLDSSNRTSLNDVSDLFVPMAGGNQIPLSQVATVSFQSGPAQISREAGKRRIYVSFNVSGRDVESVVKETQQKLEASVKLPAGYYFAYGGMFENLQRASERLQIVVPLALLLIFFLLYFTFHSLKQTAIIFAAIPMSAIGGVFALAVRGMPFSISAGVGFIALFGVAVLNGIVLISTFNQLEKDGITDVIQRVIEGTKIRLRPVLLTAAVASLGFLPMALSAGAGAEVQRPLATVVIGGLITATMLTLIVLPVLYILFSKKAGTMTSPLTKVASTLVAILCSQLFFVTDATAQNRISFAAAYDTALKNNLQLRSNDLQIERSRILSRSWREIPKTGIFVENEDTNPQDTKGILKVGLSQSIEWPGMYKARKNLLEQQVTSVELAKQISALEIKRDLQLVYYSLGYLQSRQVLWQRLDSIYSSLAQAAILRVRTGESAGLDSIAASAKSKEVSVQVRQLSHDILAQQELLKKYMGTPVNYLPETTMAGKVVVSLIDSAISDHPQLKYQQQNVSVAAAQVNVQKQTGKPAFDGRFFSQRLYGLKDPYSGFSVSVGVPLFGGSSYRNKIRAAAIERSYQQTLYDYEKISISTAYVHSWQKLQKDNELLLYYESTGLVQAEEIMKAANIAYRAGEISFAELSQFLTQSIDIQKNYLDILHQYNQSAIHLNYYLNK